MLADVTNAGALSEELERAFGTVGELVRAAGDKASAESWSSWREVLPQGPKAKWQERVRAYDGIAGLVKASDRASATNAAPALYALCFHTTKKLTESNLNIIKALWRVLGATASALRAHAWMVHASAGQPGTTRCPSAPTSLPQRRAPLLCVDRRLWTLACWI